MQNIPLSLALPGMVLAGEVRRPGRADGPALFGRGATLTEVAIERLKQVGVEVIAVRGRPLTLDSDDSLEVQLRKLDQRFRAVGHDPEMKKISQLIRKRIIHAMRS